MNIFAALRDRRRPVIGAAIVAFLLLTCGAPMVFVLSPRQALLAWRIKRMPDVDATAIHAAPAGTALLVTGHLQDNERLDKDGFVAYTRQEWMGPGSYAIAARHTVGHR